MEKKSPAFGNKRSFGPLSTCLIALLILMGWNCTARAVDNTSSGPIRKDAVPLSVTGMSKSMAGKKTVSPQEEKELLKLARATVESYVRNKIVPPYTPASPGLQQKLGAFVTLREHGQLRGCIGQFAPSSPLYTVIQQMAISAATQDPRFQPVLPEELEKLDYEISVLSPLRKIQSADEIEMGKHGVQISKGFSHGVFLPQVATETGWNKEQFLTELCTQKAGLPADCWKDPGVNLDVFTAQVFAEEKK